MCAETAGNGKRDRHAALLGGKVPTAPAIAAVLAALVCIVYFPMLRYQFVNYDVQDQIIDNPYIRGLTPGNLWHIFTSRCITSYYPIRTLSYAIDYQLWGLEPFGFKLTNGVIHLANVMLIYALVLRLLAGTQDPRLAGRFTAWRSIAAAAVAACLFGLHPVVVEPVCWIPGREELLMALGVLGCMHFHLSARQAENREACRRRIIGYHIAAVACCLVACLSNVVGVVVPVLVLAFDRLVDARPGWRRIVAGGVLLWGVAAGVAWIKITGYIAHPGVQQADQLAATVTELGLTDPSGPYDPGICDVERLKLVLRVYFLNLRTLVWPTNLTLAYLPADPVGFRHPQVVLGCLAVLLTAVVMWLVRRSRLVLFGLVWFVVALGPVSQIAPHHIIRADRHLYLPWIGLAILIAALAQQITGRLSGKSTRLLGGLACLLLVLMMAVAARRQLATWSNNRSVWEHGVKVLPNSPVANRLLADALLKDKEVDRALEHYRAALQADVFDPTNASHFARALATRDEVDKRDYRLAVQLANWADQIAAGSSREVSRDVSIVYNNFADWLRQQGRLADAVKYFRLAVRADPAYADPYFNLALLLATCDDENYRNPEQAVQFAHRGMESLDAPDVDHFMILAVVYQRADQPDRATKTIEQAIDLANAAGQIERAIALRRQLRAYRSATEAH